MSTIAQRVEKFCTWVKRDETLAQKQEVKKMIAQIREYWKKLFCDPITVTTSEGTIQIQPQRTNNILLPAGFQNPQDPAKPFPGCTNGGFAA